MDCGAVPNCVPPCGASDDCNANGLPDECETDCNNNGVPDGCDVEGESPDCNSNDVPDECDPDCDEDGTPDDCEIVQDADSDGFSDCVDQCQSNTPPGACVPPQQVNCRFPNQFCLQLSKTQCLAQNGTPSCGPPGLCDDTPCPDSLCRDGCLPGDYDADADRDLFDFRSFTNCYSGSDPQGASPSPTCLSRFDLDDDQDIDLDDLSALAPMWQPPQ